MRAPPPRWLPVVAVASLLWNLIGIAAFAMQAHMARVGLDALPPVQQQVWRAMPAWAWIVYGAAVSTGLAGAVALLLGRRQAAALFAVSLAAVIVQFGYSVLVTRIATLMGPGALAFPLVIILIAAAQTLCARHTTARGWLG